MSTTTQPKTVAIVYDNDGAEYDRAYAWQSGQTYAQSGYVVKAVADDGSISADDAQRLYDYELELFRDCFGRDHYFEEEN